MSTPVDVAVVASLARIELDESEKPRIQAQIDSILQYMNQLKELSLADVEPLSHALEATNVFRDDVVVSCPDISTDVVANAPPAEDGFFRVPRVIG